MGVRDAIRHAEQLLPGTPALRGEDRRWQAIIAIGNYIDANPSSVWRFVRRWGSHPQEDLRDAIACCLLEHLLERHFELFFPRVQLAALSEPLFGDMFLRCWKFGQAGRTKNATRFDRLQSKLASRRGPPGTCLEP